VLAHEAAVEVELDAFWLTCSCGWDQNRDRVRNDFVSWTDHIRAALASEQPE